MWAGLMAIKIPHYTPENAPLFNQNNTRKKSTIHSGAYKTIYWNFFDMYR